MKPPVRQRAAPSRFETPETPLRTNPCLVWTTREKKELLRGLKAQVGERVPVLPVQGRSDQEVSTYFSWLRGRAAREAVQTEYGKLVRQKRAQVVQDPAPIELWTDLASRTCSITEEAMSTALSQVLTIASAEPMTLRHSIPSKEPLAQGSSEEELGSSGEEPAANPNDGWNSLDFKNIYTYLSKAVRGEELPKLSDSESAVILHLLHCIPKQFQGLDAPQIGRYLYDTHTFLTTPLISKDTEETETQSESQPSTWRELGFCPLNPFMLPLQLLRPKEEQVTPPRSPC